MPRKHRIVLRVLFEVLDALLKGSAHLPSEPQKRRLEIVSGCLNIDAHGTQVC
jgi:hypothetical protein